MPLVWPRISLRVCWLCNLKPCRRSLDLELHNLSSNFRSFSSGGEAESDTQEQIRLMESPDLDPKINSYPPLDDGDSVPHIRIDRPVLNQMVLFPRYDPHKGFDGAENLQDSSKISTVKPDGVVSYPSYLHFSKGLILNCHIQKSIMKTSSQIPETRNFLSFFLHFFPQVAVRAVLQNSNSLHWDYCCAWFRFWIGCLSTNGRMIWVMTW